MKLLQLCVLTVLALVLGGPLTVSAAKPADFTPAQLDGIWTELWKSGDPKVHAPEVEKLPEAEATRRMVGKWTVLFGVAPDRLTLTLSTNRLVEVTGQKDGKAWRKNGEWRVSSDKLVLFLEQDDLPSFIFRSHQQEYIFDPWAKTMRSELKRAK